MSFPIETPIGLLPYAVTPTGEVQFLFWKSTHTTPDHSSILYGHCIGVKDRFDQSMWDVCARTWAEKTGGLYAISEELRLKREKREKKELAATQAAKSADSTAPIVTDKSKSKKSDKKDKKDKKDKRDKKSSQVDETEPASNGKFYPSITNYPTGAGLHNTLYEIPAYTPPTATKDEQQQPATTTPTATPSPQQQPQSVTLFSTQSKRFKHFQAIYKANTPAQLVYNSQKMVRKLLTSRQSSVITLTNDNITQPKFVYCIQIEYMPLWMINYILKQNGDGDCTWVHSYELIKYLSLDHINNIPHEYQTKNASESFSPQTDPHLAKELATFAANLKAVQGKAQIDAQIEHESVIFNDNIWPQLVAQYKPITTTLVPTTATPKFEQIPKVMDPENGEEQQQQEKPKIAIKGLTTKKLIGKLGKTIKTTTKSTPESTPAFSDDTPKKLIVPFSHFVELEEEEKRKQQQQENGQDPYTKFLTPQQIPINLILSSVLTIDSLLKLTKLCNNKLIGTQGEAIYQQYAESIQQQQQQSTATTPTTHLPHLPLPTYTQQYDLPQYLIKYNDDRYNDQESQDDENQQVRDKKKNFMTPSQRQQLALDMQASTGYYKCRNCRHVLFAACHLMTHTRFDFNQHVEKAHNKHLQQLRSRLQPFRKSVAEMKSHLARTEKSIRKYLLKRRIQAEIDSYGADDEGFDDDLGDDDFGDEDDGQGDDEEDNEDDGEDMYAAALRKKQALMGGMKVIEDFDDDDDEDDMDGDDQEDEPNRGLTLDDKLYDQAILITYKECYDSLRGYVQGDEVEPEDEFLGVEIEDDEEYGLREQFIEQFGEYQLALADYYREKKEVDEEINNDANMEDGEAPLDSLQSTQAALNNFSEEKGTGVYVKPVFGKASAKGFTNNNENVCQSIFLDGALDNFPPTLVPLTAGEGQIQCRNCNYRCGNYSWSGTQCSCGQWVVPGLQIPISRIDFAFRDRYQPPTIGKAAEQQSQQQPTASLTTGDSSTTTPSQQQPSSSSSKLAETPTETHRPQQHMPGPQPIQPGQQPQKGHLAGQIIGARRLPANRPPMKKPGTQ